MFFNSKLINFFFLAICISFVSADEVIETSSGIVNGTIKKNVASWNNIPYAKPPINELRWRAPQELIQPEYIIQERNIGGCIQEPSRYAGIEGQGVVGSEDCLYLDIKSPVNYQQSSLPVMFWIHGGGNTTGTKNFYDFSKMVRTQNVVVVTVNYRLGPFGWFTHPSIQPLQDGIDKASNFGTLDLIMALKWVSKNIEKFGGDPSNVLIFGESAGGHNVMSLLASPLSNNLFHKAIAQSGYTTSYTVEQSIGIDQDGSVNNELGSMAILSDSNITQLTNGTVERFNDLTLQEQSKILRSLDSQALLALYIELEEETLDYLPLLTRDGITIPKIGLLDALGKQEYAKKIPVIFGSNKDELSLWIGAHRYFVKKTYPFTRLIPIPKLKLTKPDLYKFWLKTRSDAWKYRGVDEPLMSMHRAGYKDLYAYRFDWDHQRKSFYADFPNLMGATHGFEIAFLTGNYKFGPITRYVYPKKEPLFEMEQTMMETWTNFAKHGQPKLKNNILSWPNFDPLERKFLVLDQDKDLRVLNDQKTLESIVSFSDNEPGSLLEKCMLVREVAINIGDPQFNLISQWNQNACNIYDLELEIKNLERDLLNKHGQLTVF